mmetsp:Transcript_20833/g.30612  ORF Transcript_20833/g.30612 Transcript_20833/m.30612 type:complete len:230 (+) Transcript_20833:1881-2570(+)
MYSQVHLAAAVGVTIAKITDHPADFLRRVHVEMVPIVHFHTDQLIMLNQIMHSVVVVVVVVTAITAQTRNNLADSLPKENVGMAQTANFLMKPQGVVVVLRKVQVLLVLLLLSEEAEITTHSLALLGEILRALLLEVVHKALHLEVITLVRRTIHLEVEHKILPLVVVHRRLLPLEVLEQMRQLHHLVVEVEQIRKLLHLVVVPPTRKLHHLAVVPEIHKLHHLGVVAA